METGDQTRVLLLAALPARGGRPHTNHPVPRETLGGGGMRANRARS